MFSRHGAVKKTLSRFPGSAGSISRSGAGEPTVEAADAAERLMEEQMLVALDLVGEEAREPAQAEATVEAHLALFAELSRRGLSSRSDVAVKLTEIGLGLPGGQEVALAHARRLALAARNAGSLITIDTERPDDVDVTLDLVTEIRKDHPDVGVGLQAQLRRTEADVRAFAHEGSRVRLTKGARGDALEVAPSDPHEVDLSYVRCLRTLMRGAGHPTVATHDSRLIAIAQALAAEHGRDRGSFEFQMLQGVRPQEQRRLVAQGETMRVHVPYGAPCSANLVRRLVERPFVLFAQSLTSKK